MSDGRAWYDDWWAGAEYGPWNRRTCVHWTRVLDYETDKCIKCWARIPRLRSAATNVSEYTGIARP